MSKGGGSLALFMTSGRLAEVTAALVMIKMLSPAQMGSVALLSAIFIGVYSLTNFGFDRYLVRYEGTIPDQQTIDNVWSLQLLRGLLIFLVCSLLGVAIPAVADFPNDITFQLIGVGAALLIVNLANPRLALFEREGRFRQVGVSQGVSRMAGAVMNIGIVLIFSNPWAFVIGKLGGCSLNTVFSHFFSRQMPCFRLDKDEIKNIWAFCRHLVVIAIVSVIAAQFENYYIGIVFGAEALGFYFTWARIVYLPRELFTQISDKMLFSRACQARRGNNFALERYHMRFIVLAFAVMVPFYYTVWFHGAWLISLVAGEEWVEYLWVGRYFVVISLVWMIALLFSPLILANFPELSSKIRSAEVFLLVLLMLALGKAYGIEGVLIASLIAIALATMVRLFMAYRYIFNEKEAWRHGLSFVGVGVVAFSLAFTAASVINGDAVMDAPTVMELAVFLPGILFAAYVLLQGKYVKETKTS